MINWQKHPNKDYAEWAVGYVMLSDKEIWLFSAWQNSLTKQYCLIINDNKRLDKYQERCFESKAMLFEEAKNYFLEHKERLAKEKD